MSWNKNLYPWKEIIPKEELKYKKKHEWNDDKGALTGGKWKSYY